MASNNGKLFQLLGANPALLERVDDCLRSQTLAMLLGGNLASPAALAAYRRQCRSLAFLEGTTLLRRKTFFSFHYADVMRVNNVRNSLLFATRSSDSTPPFIDSSLWEARKTEGENSLKALIRDRVRQASVVCVLVGTNTWSRPWVRYEIARSVIDGKGLLAVDINGLKHHATGSPSELGSNPLSFIGVGKVNGRYRLFELIWNQNGGDSGWIWSLYSKYQDTVERPAYLPDMPERSIIPLSRFSARYNFVAGSGASNIGTWLELAAKAAGF